MHPRAHAVPPVDVDANEDRLEEERESLQREAEAEHVAERRDEVWPENAELEAEDRAGHDADGEQCEHHLRPAARNGPVKLVSGAQVARLCEHHHRGERDAEADEWDVDGQRQRLDLTRLFEVRVSSHFGDGAPSARSSVLARVRANTCCAVIVRCRRPRPRKLIAQFATAATRFLKPVRKARCTTSHISQPGSPATRSGPTLTMARNRETVAIIPRSM